MAATEQVDSTVDILQPEVMSKEELISLLRQKKMGESNLQSMEKQALLEMYYKSVLPMPQRKYRLNRRGQAATKQQVTMAKKKRKFNEISMNSTQDTAGQKSGLFTSFRLPPSTPPANRLKPPPTNTERKIIRLKSKSSDLSGIVINDRTKVCTTKSDTTPTSDSTNSSSSVEKPNPEKAKETASSKSIKLKRASASSSDSTVTSSTMEVTPEVKNGKESKTSPLPKSPDETDDEVARKKFKTVSITWP